MSVAVQDMFADWRLPIWPSLTLALIALIYIRGWLAIRKTRPSQFTGAQLASFLMGLAVLWVAISSPMDEFADALLSVHMIEHLLLMSAVPPLLLSGLPTVPLLRGLPMFLRRSILGPVLSSYLLRRIMHWLTSPVVAWVAMNLTFLGWHVPAAFDFALEHETWHAVEHICFLGTSILFWFCILRPWPGAAIQPGWGTLIYLVSADLINTLLSAFLAFCDQPVYRYYVDHPNPFQVSPLADQILGAVIMWVIGSIAFLVPALWISLRLLGGVSHIRRASSSLEKDYVNLT